MIRKIENDNKFIKIPNKLFYKKERGNNAKLDGILKENKYDEKILLVLSNILFREDILSNSNITLENIITEIGYKPDRKLNKINDKVKNILELFTKENMISYDSDFNDIRPKQYIQLNISNCSNNFSILYCNDIIKILYNENINGLNNGKLLLVYAYINSCINVRDKETDVVRDGSQPMVAYCGYDNIQEVTGINSKSISKYIKVLEDLNLIKIFNFGRYRIKNDTKKRTYASNNFYISSRHSPTSENVNEEVRRYKKDYEITFKDRVFIGKNMTIEERRFYGKLTSLRVKKKKETITDIEITELGNMENECINHNSKLTSFQYADEKYNQSVS